MPSKRKPHRVAPPPPQTEQPLTQVQPPPRPARPPQRSLGLIRSSSSQTPKSSPLKAKQPPPRPLRPIYMPSLPLTPPKTRGRTEEQTPLQGSQLTNVSWDDMMSSPSLTPKKQELVPLIDISSSSFAQTPPFSPEYEKDTILPLSPLIPTPYVGKSVVSASSPSTLTSPLQQTSLESHFFENFLVQHESESASKQDQPIDEPALTDFSPQTGAQKICPPTVGTSSPAAPPPPPSNFKATERVPMKYKKTVTTIPMYLTAAGKPAGIGERSVFSGSTELTEQELEEIQRFFAKQNIGKTNVTHDDCRKCFGEVKLCQIILKFESGLKQFLLGLEPEAKMEKLDDFFKRVDSYNLKGSEVFIESLARLLPPTEFIENSLENQYKSLSPMAKIFFTEFSKRNNLHAIIMHEAFLNEVEVQIGDWKMAIREMSFAMDTGLSPVFQNLASEIKERANFLNQMTPAPLIKTFDLHKWVDGLKQKGKGGVCIVDLIQKFSPQNENEWMKIQNRLQNSKNISDIRDNFEATLTDFNRRMTEVAESEQLKSTFYTRMTTIKNGLLNVQQRFDGSLEKEKELQHYYHTDINSHDILMVLSTVSVTVLEAIRKKVSTLPLKFRKINSLDSHLQ